METPTPSAFQCPSCGKLSQAVAGEGGEKICKECGYEFKKPIRVAPRGAGGREESRAKFVQRDVGSRRRVVNRHRVVQPVKPASPAEMPPESAAGDSKRMEEVVLEDGTRKVMKRRKRKKAESKRGLFFVGLWIVLLVALAIGVNEFIKRDHQPELETAEEREKRVLEAQEAQVQTYLNEHLPACRKALREFFEATNSESRAQSVRDQVRVTPRMTTYYLANLAIRPEGEFRLQSSGLRLMGKEKAIETVWEFGDGRLIEVVFVRDEDRWVVDWEEFVRFGTVPWHRFVAGQEREGEFRLYMRRRQVLNEGENYYAIQFYPALDDAALRQRGESPRVLVSIDSELGEQLKQHWERAVPNPGVGGTMFGKRDARELSRVRVHLAWKTASDGEGIMELREILAGEWWGDGYAGALESGQLDGAGAEEVLEGGQEAEDQGLAPGTTGDEA